MFQIQTPEILEVLDPFHGGDLVVGEVEFDDVLVVDDGGDGVQEVVFQGDVLEIGEGFDVVDVGEGLVGDFEGFYLGGGEGGEEVVERGGGGGGFGEGEVLAALLLVEMVVDEFGLVGGGDRGEEGESGGEVVEVREGCL